MSSLKKRTPSIYVDGKTLSQIAEESGIKLDTVRHRYSRGIHDYEGLTKDSHINKTYNSLKRAYNIMSASQRVMERIWELDVPLTDISRATGVSRTTIYCFLYDGIDISSMRLAKICKYLDLSMDEVMGLNKN